MKILKLESLKPLLFFPKTLADIASERIQGKFEHVFFAAQQGNLSVCSSNLPQLTEAAYRNMMSVLSIKAFNDDEDFIWDC